MLSKRSGILAFWAATLAAMVLVSSFIAPDHDGDDVLRLLQVRAWLDGQSWFDLTQYRIDPPGGVTMHWTRWVDLPIALLVFVLRPLLGEAQAESAALIVVPLLTLTALAGAVWAVTKRWFGQRAAVLAVLLIAATPAVTLQIHPQRIDHHGWQIVLAVAALGLLLDRTRRVAPVWLGGVLALSLAVSLEGLPLVAAFLAVLGLDWLRDPAQRWRLVVASRSFAAASVLLWIASHGFAQGFGWCDTIAPAHLFAFVLAAAGVQVLAQFERAMLVQRLAGLAIVGTIAAASFLSFAPQCAAGAFAQLDPLVAKVWLAQVTEARAIWGVSPVLAATLISPALAGLAVLLFSLPSAQEEQRAMLQAYALILAAAVLVGSLVVRASATACGLALPALAWQIARWQPGADPAASPRVRLLRLFGIVLVALPWVPALALVRAVSGSAPAPQVAFICKPDKAATELAKLPPGLILTPFDYSAELLAAGPHSVVASPHHRGTAAMRWTIETFTAAPAAARSAIAARGVSYVAVCPGQPELVNQALDAPSGFGAALAAGAVPDWLDEVPMPEASGLRVWRVRP